jgi:hypothetical protein
LIFGSKTVKYYHNKDGQRYFYTCLNLDRKKGPAVIWYNGTKFWMINGLYHRKGGPAVIFPNGNCEWWVDDVLISRDR